ncbi:MAG TPA: c-type cytochrome, partial [Gammaproteobacteria bacterium]
MRAVGGACVLALVALPAVAQRDGATWDGAYTEEQAQRGERLYTEQCAQCHGTTLGGIEAAPALTGLEFFAKWEPETPGALLERTRLSMPPASPASLSRTESADLVAYLLRTGGYAAGTTPLEGVATLAQGSSAASARSAPAADLEASTAAARTAGIDAGGEWRTYGGDLGHTRYSRLDQIDAANFDSLEIAWGFKTDNLGPRPEFNFQSTPLMVGRRLYSTAGTRRAVVALDAGTGELQWVHSEDEGARGAAAPRQLSGRGLAYWTDGADERILYVTPGYRLVALDARTGDRVAGFGEDGVVDLKRDLDPTLELTNAPIGLHATPIVGGDVVLVGSAFETGANPRSISNVKGAVRAFDVRSGKRMWMFNTIPGPGEFGHETWEDGSAEYTGNTGVWGQISVDLELGLAYL